MQTTRSTGGYDWGGRQDRWIVSRLRIASDLRGVSHLRIVSRLRIASHLRTTSRLELVRHIDFERRALSRTLLRRAGLAPTAFSYRNIPRVHSYITTRRCMAICLSSRREQAPALRKTAHIGWLTRTANKKAALVSNTKTDYKKIEKRLSMQRVR